MGVRVGIPVLVWLTPACLAAYGVGDVEWLDPILEPLAAVRRPDVQELTGAQVAAAESICRLSALCRPALVGALQRCRMGASVFAVADWYFRNQHFEKACLLYELVLFYERHGGLARYIEFLLDRGADDHEIRRRLTDLEEMREYVKPKQGLL